MPMVAQEVNLQQQLSTQILFHPSRETTAFARGRAVPSVLVAIPDIHGQQEQQLQVLI